MSERDNPYSADFGTQMTASVNSGRRTSEPAAGPAVQGNGLSADGLIAGAGEAGGADLIKETTTAAFSDDVIKESRNQPVLIDFWAPWCGPCRQLTPALEKAVRDARGKVKLVKLNIDDHPSIPGQMGIQSIPAVIAFVDGRPADGFMGAVPESQIKQFIDKLAGAGGGDDQAAAIDGAIAEAKAALAEGDINSAAEGFSAVLRIEPGHTKALAGMAECLFQAGQTDQMGAILDQFSDEQRKDSDVASLLARIAQAEEVARLGDPAALEARLANNPEDHAARRDLAKILNVKGKREAAAGHLLTIMRKDRAWEDDGARRELLTFFEAWGPSDPATLAARRKLSSILFS